MSPKPHILFVDDERNIIEGLKRGLRSNRKVWDMSFANSGEEALEIIAYKPVDIVISDMRMPKMDGAELLEKIRDLSPGTTRIILSGYSEEEAILKVVGPAHQYIAKPCDFEVLQDIITRLVTLRNMIEHSKVRTVINGKMNIPSLPKVFSSLMDELENPNSSTKAISDIISRDLGLKSQIMKVCNSSFFGLPQTITNLETGINMLGLDTIRSMSILTGVFSSFNGSDKIHKVLERLCENSLKIAVVSRKIAEASGLDEQTCNLVASAGTLSHVGTLIIATSFQDQFTLAGKMSESYGVSIDFYERELVGTDHAMIGAYFLGLWGFPLSVCEAVAYHHRPNLAKPKEQPILTILHFAQTLTKAIGNKKVDLNVLEKGIDRQFLHEQKFDISSDVWHKIISENVIRGA